MQICAKQACSSPWQAELDSSQAEQGLTWAELMKQLSWAQSSQAESIAWDPAGVDYIIRNSSSFINILISSCWSAVEKNVVSAD